MDISYRLEIDINLLHKRALRVRRKLVPAADQSTLLVGE